MRYLEVEVRGIVQGVGFRPFVYRLAGELGLKGSVSNTPRGVDIRVCGGDGDQTYLFLRALREKAPPQAVIEDIKVRAIEPFDAPSFEIVASTDGQDSSVLVSPDLAICDDCVRELFDPSDRRYRYPFINCTNCGPRFTIINATPYDRPNTSMARFRMCAECEREYHDPSDRRFHAQPNACPSCGPRLWLTGPDGVEMEGDPIENAARLLRSGGIVAVKGLGGFQLACDATSDRTVAELRRRKNRYGKPFAVMVGSLDEAGAHCSVDEHEARLLASPASPIVLLVEKEGSTISGEVAGGLHRQGLFLPCTPLHHLLMSEVGIPLVMTSGNVSSEPIVKDNRDARVKLGHIADCFLMHDRDIVVRYDDSVVMSMDGREYPLRRARGYAPYPVRVSPEAEVEVLAVGADLKNTFCLLRGEQAFVGQHIGDMETHDEVEHFERALEALKRLFSLRPRLVAHDMHPDYLTTRLALETGLPGVAVQHHHAHIASCMAESDETGSVIGVAWDGTGYGDDATVWGGEFLMCDRLDYRRYAHLYRYPMPGSELCVFKIYRMAAGVLSEVLGGPEPALEALESLVPIGEEEAVSLKFQLEQGFNAPLTSSAGRLFDSVAALTGLRNEAQYDGQAACELEAVALKTRERYDFTLDRTMRPWTVDTRPLVSGILDDIGAGVSTGEIAGRFHATMAVIISRTAAAVREETGLSTVALSGGVFQNALLTRMVKEDLEELGFRVLLHRRVPCNDGGVSLGQAVVAASRRSSTVGGAGTGANP